MLCLDHEGGHGGSSRSLYALLSHINSPDVRLEVWCRRSGHIEDLYRGIGVPCRVVPELPVLTSQPRTFDNFVEYPRFFRRVRRQRDLLRRVATQIDDHFNVVHWNHQSFWWMARWLRRRTRAAFVMHIRGRLIDTPFARWQERTTLKLMDELIYITENEQTHFQKLAGRAPGRVIFNVPPKGTPEFRLHPAVPADGRLVVASLSNYSWVRGVDRLVDLAAALRDRGRRDVLFVIAGNMQLPKRLPGELGAVAARKGTLEDYVVQRGLVDYFLFLGHVAEPERVLAACDVLAKLSRENNPWGRDMLEALHFGKPVLTVGEWTEFVEHDVTGIMPPKFDVETMTDSLCRLADDREYCRSLGAAGSARIAERCDGPSKAAELVAVWKQAVERTRVQQTA